jgi:hypothetical protein
LPVDIPLIVAFFANTQLEKHFSPLYRNPA